MKKIGALVSVMEALAVLLIWTSPSGELHAQPRPAVTIASDSYTSNESFVCGRQTPSCRLLVCVKLDTKSDGSQNIWALVDMSDAHGVLEIAGPVTKSRTGVMSFRFEDGWGNVGKGTFKTLGTKGYLRLQVISSGPDADPLVRRNYLDSTVEKGACNTDRSKKDGSGHAPHK